MYIKNKFIAFFIFITILILSTLNIKNPEKTKFYLFTSKTEKISLGNLITISFISGLTFGSILNLISKNNLQESLKDNSINEEDTTDEININNELQSDRPPERDIRESQPTISVNYRFVDQDNNSYTSQKNNKKFNNKDDDWLNDDNEW
tara:strand:+ start:166 stop:612 length:447 start_codon:yes stop_codon:yes gene_type:complete